MSRKIDFNEIQREVNRWATYKKTFYEILELCNQNRDTISKADQLNLEGKFLSLCFQAQAITDNGYTKHMQKDFPHIYEDICFYQGMYQKIKVVIKNTLRKEFKCGSTNLLDLFSVLEVDCE